MPRGMKAELRSLSADSAAVVGAYLMAATQLVDTDPELAFKHAEAARRRAPRLPIVREASAETAYAAGLYDEALTQYKALRRMTGSPDIIPVIVDCLRAAKKYREALELAAEGAEEITDPSMALELLIVTAGVRVDMGQREEALRLLRREIEHPSVPHPHLAKARLLYAFADLLAQSGDMENAYRGFAQAARLDPEGRTAALERLDAMDGLVLDLDETEFEESTDEAEDDEGDTAADEADDAEVDDEVDDDEAEEDEAEEDEAEEDEAEEDEAEGPVEEGDED